MDTTMTHLVFTSFDLGALPALRNVANICVSTVKNRCVLIDFTLFSHLFHNIVTNSLQYCHKYFTNAENPGIARFQYPLDIPKYDAKFRASLKCTESYNFVQKCVSQNWVCPVGKVLGSLPRVFCSVLEPANTHLRPNVKNVRKTSIV